MMNEQVFKTLKPYMVIMVNMKNTGLMECKIKSKPYYNADCDEPGWEVDTNNGMISIDNEIYIKEFRDKTEQGYEVLALVNDGECWHAVCHRPKTNDYVFCYCYDIYTGTWGNGHYVSTYQQAIKLLVEHIN